MSTTTTPPVGTEMLILGYQGQEQRNAAANPHSNAGGHFRRITTNDDLEKMGQEIADNLRANIP